MYRTCFHVKNYTDSECQVFLSPDRTNVSKHIEDEVQTYLTFVNLVRDIIESVVPAVLSFFLGVWSDTYGRKPLIVWPLLGKFFFVSFRAESTCQELVNLSILKLWVEFNTYVSSLTCSSHCTFCDCSLTLETCYCHCFHNAICILFIHQLID